MGGRGASGGVGGGGATGAFRKAGTMFTNMDGLDRQAVEQSLKGVKDVLRDMGIPLSSIPEMVGANARGDTFMSVRGTGTVNFSRQVYQDLETAQKATANKNGQFVASGLYATGTHEAGHIAVREIIQRTITDRHARAQAWKNKTVEKQILREAQARYGSNPRISRYGSTDYSEKIAEAVSDVYTNKGRANPYSKVIVDVMKKKLRGK